MFLEPGVGLKKLYEGACMGHCFKDKRQICKICKFVKACKLQWNEKSDSSEHRAAFCFVMHCSHCVAIGPNQAKVVKEILSTSFVS